jgi:SpoVK/Ycf46/Vps4 family AAA+-type ATPase
MTAVMEEIDQFWTLKPNFDKLGLLHHRGILVYGPPGTGKSAMMQQVAERMVKQDNVLFFAHGLGGLMAGLQAFRDVEPTRKAVVVLEDLDEYLQWSERDLLQLLDGENSVDNVLFLASTNYIQKFPPRLLRPGRFDRKVFLGFPPIEGRRTYLQNKLKGTESAEAIEELAVKTDGMSFGHLRELVIAAFAFKEPIEKVLRRLKVTGGQIPERRGALTITEGRIRFKETGEVAQVVDRMMSKEVGCG